VTRISTLHRSQEGVPKGLAVLETWRGKSTPTLHSAVDPDNRRPTTLTSALNECIIADALIEAGLEREFDLWKSARSLTDLAILQLIAKMRVCD
jgi:hypothetical protein